MSRLRRIYGLPFATLSVFFASVFFLGTTAYAQSPIPLSDQRQAIQEHSQIMQEKAMILEATSKELVELEEKKQELSKALESEKRLIEDLKEKIAEIHAHFSDEMQSLDSTQSLESLRVKVLGTSVHDALMLLYCFNSWISPVVSIQ